MFFFLITLIYLNRRHRHQFPFEMPLSKTFNKKIKFISLGLS